MLVDLAKMAKIHKFGLANSLLHSPMATWLTLTGTLPYLSEYVCLIWLRSDSRVLKKGVQTVTHKTDKVVL